MNAKMMMIDFCTKLPVRRKTIMNVEYYDQSSIVVYLAQHIQNDSDDRHRPGSFAPALQGCFR